MGGEEWEKRVTPGPIYIPVVVGPTGQLGPFAGWTNEERRRHFELKLNALLTSVSNEAYDREKEAGSSHERCLEKAEEARKALDPRNLP